MPKFNVQGPDGKSYNVDGPDAQGAVEAVKKMIGGGQPLPTMGADRTFNTAAAGGIPIVGPAVDWLASHAVAGVKTLAEGENPFGGGTLSSQITGETPFQRNLRIVNERAAAVDAAAGAAHPIAQGAGEVAGQVGGSMVLAAPFAAPLATASRGAQIAAGALGGAAVNGVDTAARTDGTMTDKLSAALPAAAVGGALGGAAPVIAGMIGRGAQRIANAVARARALKGTGVSPQAARVILGSSRADGAIGGAGEANIRAAGPDAMLVDAGGSLQQTLDQAVQNSGAGGRQAAAAVEQRAGAALGKTNQALDRGLGPETGVFAGEKAIRQNSQAARKMAYDAAYSQPIDYSSPEGQSIEKMIKNSVPGRVVNKAEEMMKADGVWNQNVHKLAVQMPDGSFQITRMPNVQELDYITRALNDTADAANGAGKLGGTTNEGRIYGKLASRIRDTLKTAVPEYGIALDVAGDAIGQRSALQFGAELLKPGTMRDEAASIIKGYSPEDLMQARKGVRATIAEKLANVKKMASDGNLDAREARVALQDLSSRAAREKIGMLMPKNEANALFRSLDEAEKALSLRAGIATNSKTYARQAAEKRVDAAIEPGALGKLAQGDVPGAGKKLTQTILGSGNDVQAANKEKVYEEITRALTEHRGADALKLIQSLQAADQTFGKATRLGELAGPHVFGATVGGGTAAAANSPLAPFLGLQGRQ